MNSQESKLSQNPSTRLFGLSQNGTKVYLRTITNKNGMELSVCDFGATVTHLKIPDGNNKSIDVVLGFESVEDYEHSYTLSHKPFLGAAVGLYAGRINHGKLTIDGKSIQLDTNLGIHHLHGGFQNISNQIWLFKDYTSGENQSLTYELSIPENQGNFPGKTTVHANYQLLENDSIKITFTAISSENTPINLTQHNYFNLNGHTESVEGMQLEIYADKFLETDQDLIPTGKFIPTAGSIYDFNNLRACPELIDTTFILNQSIAATLYSPKTELQMDIFTNQPGVHVFVGGNCGSYLSGKESAQYHNLSGITFETQNFPDAPNHSNFPNAILKKGETYYNETIFQFKKNYK